MCRISPAPLGLIIVLGQSFCTPALALEARVFRKIPERFVPLRIVEAVIAANDIRKRAMARKVSAAFGGALRGKTIAVLGLTFKPNTDDMREAPSIPLITALQDMGAVVRAFDPVGMEHAKALLPDVVYCDGPS